jgi:hypothetical protein
MAIDGAELARWFAAIDEAVRPIEELTAELMKPVGAV